MRNATAGVIVGLMVVSGSTARAQTVFGGAGMVSLWDDETMLGRGLLVSGGIAHPLGRHVAVEGELAWGRHLRDSGYLAAEGTPLIGTARLAYLFQRPESRARAFASAGVSVVRSTGTLTMRSIVRGPGGLPIEGPSEQRDWSMTKPAFEVGAGVTIRAGKSTDRLSFRPEVRWTSTSGDDASSRSTLEPPLWIIRAGVTVEWQ
jgi:hypothetical protein